MQQHADVPASLVTWFYNCYMLSNSQYCTVRQFHLWTSKQLLKIKCTNSQNKPQL